MYRRIDTMNFVREQFKNFLEDKQPHRYRDILEYVRGKAEGTEHEGLVEQNNMVMALKKLVDDPTSGYVRVRHGVYQKCAPQMAVEWKPADALSMLYGLLDEACVLQVRLNDIYIQQKNEQPKAAQVNAPIYSATAERLDTMIDCLTAWIADTEDMSDVPVQEDTPEQDFSMRMS